MLSNTATPIYYGMFRDAVVRGEIPVNNEIVMEMNRIDELIRNPNYYYDDEAINGYVAYCENELTLTDGSAMTLLDSFKLWAEQLFGWFYYSETSVFVPNRFGRGGHYQKKRTKKRLRHKQYIILGRGGSKSMYLSSIQSFVQNVDPSTTHGVTTAPTMMQAEEVMAPIRTAILRARGPLFRFLTEGSLQNTTGNRAERQQLASTKKGIENFMNGSDIQIRPMSIDKLQGLRCKCATVDEWLSGDIREDVVGALEQGASKVDDWLIVATSSEGTVRNGAGDTIKLELMSILKGEYYAPHVSIFYYRLDDISEVGDPAMWVKANPNLGKTVSYETYQLEVERAEKSPSVRNDILAKRFGIPMEGFTYFFTYEETLPTRKKAEFFGMPCSLGIDLSMGDDFTAFTFLFPLARGEIGVKGYCYISELTYSRLPSATRYKYEEFIREGSLFVMPGTVIDIMAVYQHLMEIIDRNEYDVRSVGYDPYNAKDFIAKWETENSPFGIEKVIQGAKTESVPLGELKKLASERMLIFDQSVLTYTMGNSIVLEDTNGNRKLHKRRNDEKIDSVSAMMDAYVAYKINKELFE